MVSSITQDPYSIIISLKLASSVNLNIGAPPRPTELTAWLPVAAVSYLRFHGELSSFRSYLRFLPNQELEIQNADNFWTACTPPLFKLPTPDPELSHPRRPAPGPT